MQGSVDDARRAAERWKHLIEACDGDDAKADRLLLQQSSTAPPFDVVAQKHIKSLTDVRPATVNQYLRYLDNYFEDILPLPVDAVTTEVMPLADTPSGAYYLAEDEHQQYLHKVPHGYCPHHSTGVACRLPD